MNDIRKYIKWILFIVLFFILTDYKSYEFNKSEIDKILFINVFAIDYSKENPDNVKVTASSRNVKSNGGSDSSGSQKTNVINMSSEGKTFFEAVRKLNATSIKKVFFGHMEHTLIGEKAAESGILKYLDLLERDHEIRLNSLVFIVKGDTAEQVLDQTNTSEYYLSDRLNNLIDNRGGMSISGKTELFNLIGIFDNKNISAAIPCISLVKSVKKGEDEEASKMDIKLDGFAIFSGDKMTGYINGNEARGLNWIRGEVKSGIIVVKNDSGEDVSLEIISSNVKLVPNFDGDKLTVSINIRMTSNLGEIQGRENVFNEKSFKIMEEQQEAAIKSEVENAISIAQQNNTDFLQISEAIEHKYPVRWGKIKDNWINMFPEVKFSINVESNINRTYDIERPTGGEE